MTARPENRMHYFNTTNTYYQHDLLDTLSLLSCFCDLMVIIMFVTLRVVTDPFEDESSIIQRFRTLIHVRVIV